MDCGYIYYKYNIIKIKIITKWFKKYEIFRFSALEADCQHFLKESFRPCVCVCVMYTPCLCLPASFSCFVKHAVLAEFIQPRFLLCEMWFHQHNTPLCPLPSSATQVPGHFLQWSKRENKNSRCVFNWKYQWCLFSYEMDSFRWNHCWHALWM